MITVRGPTIPSSSTVALSAITCAERNNTEKARAAVKGWGQEISPSFPEDARSSAVAGPVD
jgi:hypothetical protein